MITLGELRRILAGLPDETMLYGHEEVAGLPPHGIGVRSASGEYLGFLVAYDTEVQDEQTELGLLAPNQGGTS